MKPVDKTEKSIRFGCGFVLGLFVFGISSFWALYDERNLYVVTVFVAALAFGLAAIRYGNVFLRWFGKWFSWFS